MAKEIIAPEFGQRLRVALAAKGITASDLARHLGVTRMTTCHWTNGQRMPRSKHLVPLCGYLGISMDWLMEVSFIDCLRDYQIPLNQTRMLDTLINLHLNEVLSEGQCSRATGLSRIEIRRLADEARNLSEAAE